MDDNGRKPVLLEPATDCREATALPSAGFFLVHPIGGRLFAWSRPGSGAEFIVEVPKQPGAKAQISSGKIKVPLLA